MIWLIRNILLALASETSPISLVFSVIFGLLLGFCPIDNLIWISLFLIVFLVRVNLSLVLTFFTIGKLLSFIFIGTIFSIGESLLTHSSLISFWEHLYNVPIVAISGYNHKMVLGGIVFALILGIISIPITLKITTNFRSYVLPWLEKLWFIKLFKGSKLYQIYIKVLG